MALVTAGSKGIGFAVAQGLAAEGVKVALCARTAAAVEEAAAAVGGTGFVADVSSEGDIARLFDEVREALGAPDILITNAGGPPSGTPTQLGLSGWDDAYNLTLMSVVRLVQYALPAMRKKGWGRIINVTSLSVREPVPTLTLSNAFRAAVTSYAKTLAGEVSKDGVTVNNVAPVTPRRRERKSCSAVRRGRSSRPTSRWAVLRRRKKLPPQQYF